MAVAINNKGNKGVEYVRKVYFRTSLGRQAQAADSNGEGWRAFALLHSVDSEHERGATGTRGAGALLQNQARRGGTSFE